MFVILVGTPCSGKDTIARYLETKHEFSRVGTEASAGAVSGQAEQQQAIPLPLPQLFARLCYSELAIKLCHDEHNDRTRSVTVHQEAFCFGRRGRWTVDGSMGAESKQVRHLRLLVHTYSLCSSFSKEYHRLTSRPHWRLSSPSMTR
jgi:hypothetical protein